MKATPITAYLSGPMSGIPDFNRTAFAVAEVALPTTTADGHPIHVISPGLLGDRTGWEWSDYMRCALRSLSETDLVVELPGIEEHGSRGARLELHIARELGIPIAALDRLTDPASPEHLAIRVIAPPERREPWHEQPRHRIALERASRFSAEHNPLTTTEPAPRPQ